MHRSLFVLTGVAILMAACRAPEAGSKSASTYASIQVAPPREGHVLVTVGGGPVKNKGEHWFPEGSTLATVLDWAGLDTVAPPRKVYVVSTDGSVIRCRVADRPRKELETVRMTHGMRISVPWDRCFGLAPNPALDRTPEERQIYCATRTHGDNNEAMSHWRHVAQLTPSLILPSRP